MRILVLLGLFALVALAQVAPTAALTGTVTDPTSASIPNATVILVNGAGDRVSMFDAWADSITLGNGAGDSVFAQSEDAGGNDNTITLGNGAGDTVNDFEIGGVVGGGVNDKITLGDGAGDVVNINALGATIKLGNGDGDVVNVSGNLALVSLGNGNNDIVMASYTA